MLQVSGSNRLLTILTLFLLCAAVFGCTQVADETPAVVAPTPEVSVPPDVIEAREALLSFLRDGANECVPPAGVRWGSRPKPRSS